jgi:hypothetical protein
MAKKSKWIRNGLMVLFMVLSSVCWAGGKKDRQTQSENQKPQVEVVRQQTAEPAVPPPPPSNPYFTGEGGKGISLGIGVPESQGLGENQAYLPTVVQGILVADISKYSAISVLDRVSLDRVINETLDSTFEDDVDIVRLGHVAQVGNWMTGNIIRTSTGYSLQINITDTTSDAKTTASYAGTCTAAQFDDHSAIHRASLDLLTQMGVQLTDTARDELEKASTPQNVNAQTALAQGIVAQQRGTVIEALAYYYDAVSFDPQLPEGNERLSILSSNISSGNIGENVRNDIQRRNEWKKILDEAEQFFQQHPPFELIYDPFLAQGRVDYEKETVDLSFALQIRQTGGFKILENIRKGLIETGRMEEWGFGFWPVRGQSANSMFGPGVSRRMDNRGGRIFKIEAVLLNGQGRQLSTGTEEIFYTLEFVEGNNPALKNPYSPPTPKGNVGEPWGGDYRWWDTSRFSLSFYPWSSPRTSDTPTIDFKAVNANDITDNLTIKIVSINGVDAAKNPGCIKISTMPIER